LFCLKGKSRRLKDDTVSVLTDSLHTSAHRTVHSITARKEEKKSIDVLMHWVYGAPCVAAVDMSSFYVFYRFMLVL